MKTSKILASVLATTILLTTWVFADNSQSWATAPQVKVQQVKTLKKVWMKKVTKNTKKVTKAKKAWTTKKVTTSTKK